MAESTFQQETIEAYQYDRRNNINESGVLMVTITLSEYRELVSKCAKAEQIKSDKTNFELRREVERLKERLAEVVINGDMEGSEQ